MSTLLRTVLGGAALLLTASIGLAAPASAQTTAVSPNPTSDAAVNQTAAVCMPDFREPGTRIRSEPNTASAILGTGNPGDCLRENSVTEAQLVQCESGTQSTRWYNITNLRTGVTGWISACLWP